MTGFELDRHILRPVPDPGQDVGQDLDPPTIEIEDWLTFREKAGQRIPFLVEGLWPEGAFGFIASPPKKGKTWIGFSLALAIATGTSYLDAFKVADPRTVLYIALEGHRAAIEARLAALQRGIGIDPDGQIERLKIAYKPRGINLAEPTWAEALANAADRCDAAMIIVDVLRSAARIKENDAAEFAALVHNLSGVMSDGRAIAMLHHFTKLSETSKERTPMERMSGSGAMGGALDVGIYITGSENNARRLRLEFDCRDIAAPPALSVELFGDGSGDHGSFTADDKAWWSAPDHEVEEDDLKASTEEIAAWLENLGEDATRSHIMAAFECSDKTVSRREPFMPKHGIEVITKPGRPTVYRFVGLPKEDPQQSLLTPDTHPGHDPGQTPDTKPVSGVGNGSTKPIAAVPDPGHDTTPDTDVVSDLNPSVHAGSTQDTPRTPTEIAPPVSGVATPADTALAERWADMLGDPNDEGET